MKNNISGAKLDLKSEGNLKESRYFYSLLITLKIVNNLTYHFEKSFHDKFVTIPYKLKFYSLLLHLYSNHMIMFKHKLYCLVFLLLTVSSCNTKSSNSTEGDFHLKVRITDIADGTKIVLKKQENKTIISIDSTIAKNDEFEFRGNLETPSMFGIFIDSIRGGLFPLIESGSITITAHKDSLFAPSIKGSKLNDELEKFKDGSQKIVSKINDLFIQIQKARSENDLEKINEINDKMQAINEENTQYSLDYAKNNPDSFISSIILQSLLRIPEIDINEVKSIYASFSDDVKKSEYSKNIFDFIEST